MKKKIRTPAILQSKRIRADAKEFSEWLNSEGKPQELFRPLVQMTTMTAKDLYKNRRSDTLAADDPFISYEEKSTRILRGIRRQYPSEKRCVDYQIRGGRRSSGDGSLQFSEQPIRTRGRAHWEASLSLDRFYFLAEHGAFAAFERCALPTCRKYFFAFPRHKRYCSDEHQRAGYDLSPQRKKDNLDYQKKYYHEWLSAEAKRMQKLAARRGLNAKLPLSGLKKKLKGL
jgi:hypothetical protein